MSVIDILSLVALLWIIQFYLGGENQSFIPSWMPERSSLWPIGIFVILFAIKNTVGFFISRVGHSFISNVALRISVLNLKNYQQAPFEEFINVDSSVHIRKIAFQPYEFGQYILTGFQQIITQGSLILFTIMAILVFNAKLFLLLLLILLPPALLVFYLIKKQSENNRIGIQSSNESSFRYLLDALKGYVEGNVYGRNSFFRQRFLQQRRLFSTYLFNSISLQSLPGRFIEVFAVLGLFLLILIAKLNADAGSSPLLPVFFVLHGYLENYPVVPLSDTVILTLQYLGAALVLVLIFFWLLGSWEKATLMSFIILLAFLFFGPFHDFVVKLAGNGFISKFNFLLPAILVFYILCFIQAQTIFCLEHSHYLIINILPL